jgi:hypothetical protein
VAYPRKLITPPSGRTTPSHDGASVSELTLKLILEFLQEPSKEIPGILSGRLSVLFWRISRAEVVQYKDFSVIVYTDDTVVAE